jgi:hypothetical protein
MNDISKDEFELSIIMPCLNEAETLAVCIQKAFQGMQAHQIQGEVIIADNGSTDGSQDIAAGYGARVIPVAHRGYGCALRAGIAAAQGKYVIMADSDDSYDLTYTQPFMEKLREGYQLVTGTRLKGTIQPGAMPWLHQRLGNPVLTWLGNRLFGTDLSDYHCGMRGFDRVMIQSLGLRTTGMEFATEMLAKAAHAKMKTIEIPITYYPDGRTRPPHLHTWRDGWRHLRFMLLLSPAWVLLYPGLLLMILGLIGGVLLIPGPLMLSSSVGLDVHSLLVSGIAVVIGAQILTLWLCARLFATHIGLLPTTRFIKAITEGSPLGIGIAVGSVLFISGLIPSLQAFHIWSSKEFGALNYRDTLRWLIPGLVLIALGVQAFFASFVVSLLSFTKDWTITQ